MCASERTTLVQRAVYAVRGRSSTKLARKEGMMGRPAASERRRIILGIATATLVVLLIIGCIEITGSETALRERFFWLQMFTGTSWPTEPSWGTFQKSSPWLFALGATVQVMLGIGPLLAVLSLVWMMLTEGRTTMRLSQLLRTRDAALKLALKQEIRRRCDQIDDATLSATLDNVFATTTEKWKKEIEEVFLPAGRAQRVLEELDEDR